MVIKTISKLSDMAKAVHILEKEKVSKSLNIDFTIYKDDTVVARTNTTVLDLNDPIVNDSAPTNPKIGQLWLDTSMSPSILKMWDGANWVNSGYQNGKTVYTSMPEAGKYSPGDLWILADNEVYNGYTAGSILRANENLEWVDALSDVSSTIKNIKESFEWDNAGIKVMRRVEDANGNIIKPFYVHIDSTKMGFHSVEYQNGVAKNDVEVVHIGNNSSIIQNATFQGSDGTKFENQVSFKKQINIHTPDANAGFAWKVESNNSLSLAIIN